MDIANELVKFITAAQNSGNRSKQKEIGPSEVGSCSRALWSRLHGVEPTNSHNLLRFPSVFGTAIHSYIQEAFRRQDPFEERFLIESEWRSEQYNLLGHIDLYDKKNKEVIDWKSSTKKNFGGGYFPSKSQRWQIQLYGLLLEENGLEVEKVTLVGIPRDGNERDIVIHSEPYDRNVAMEALSHASIVQNSQIPPAPERDIAFCKNYCAFYDPEGSGCKGRPKELAEGAIIEDDVVVRAVNDYLRVTEQIKQLEQQKDFIKATLEGINGVTPDGVKVLWSKVAGRKSLDTDYVAQFFEKYSEPLPYKSGEETYRLVVK